MKNLEELISELESAIPHYQLINSTISTGSVGWHVEHTLLTLNLIIKELNKSNPKGYKWSFDIRRSFVLAVGKIPRGRVKAPSIVEPTIAFNEGTLQQHIALSKQSLKTIALLSPNNYFTHPFLGNFNLKPSVRFLKIHTNHHLKIINDIIKNS